MKLRSRTISEARLFRASIRAGFGLMAVLLLHGCYSPHFDEGLSFSIGFAKELEHVASFGPFGADESAMQGGYFVPDRDLFPMGGYWIKALGDNLTARYVLGSTLYGERSTTSNLFRADAVAYPLSSTTASPVSSMGKALAAIFASDLDGGVIAMGADASYNLNTIGDLTLSVNTSLTMPYYLLGASYTIPSGNPTVDTVSLIYASEASGYQLAGTAFFLNNAAALSAAAQTCDLATYDGPRLEPGAFFCYDSPHARYYLSGRRSTDGSVYSAYWTTDLFYLPTVMPEVTAKLVAVLTTGELLGKDGTEMPLYDGGGAYETTLHTGSIRFVFEQLDGATWYSYFTRALWISEGEGDQGKILIDVWRYPTASLRSLGIP